MKFQAACDGCDLCLMFSRGGGTGGQDDWSRGDCSTAARHGGACGDFGQHLEAAARRGRRGGMVIGAIDQKGREGRRDYRGSQTPVPGIPVPGSASRCMTSRGAKLSWLCNVSPVMWFSSLVVVHGVQREDGWCSAAGSGEVAVRGQVLDGAR
jgi:hypothetical protein